MTVNDLERPEDGTPPDETDISLRAYSRLETCVQCSDSEVDALLNF